jgi:hypothetical protein
VNSTLVGFQTQYRVLQGAGKKRQVGLLRTMARSATAGKQKVQTYDPLPEEVALKSCALKDIAQVFAASSRGSKKTAPGAGMRTIAKLGAYVSRINRFNSARVTRFDMLVRGDSIIAVEMAVLWSCNGPDGFQSRPVIFKYPDSTFLAAPIDKNGFFAYDGYLYGIRVQYSGRVLGPQAIGHVQLDYSSPPDSNGLATVCRTGHGNWNGSLYTNPDDFKMFGPIGVAGT